MSQKKKKKPFSFAFQHLPYIDVTKHDEKPPAPHEPIHENLVV